MRSSAPGSVGVRYVERFQVSGDNRLQNVINYQVAIAMLLGNAKLLSYNLPINHPVKVIMIGKLWIYLIGGLIVLFPDLSLEQGRCISGMLFKEPVKISIIFKVQPAGYFFYRMFSPE